MLMGKKSPAALFSDLGSAGPVLCRGTGGTAERIFSDAFSSHARRLPVNLTVAIGPLIALIAGILILIVPRLLNYIVAIYLIIIGLLGLFGGRLLS
jgi:hypothetical protein